MTVTINGQTFPITQDPIGCVYTLSVASLDVADQGGRQDFRIHTPVGCGWAVTSSDSWISVRTPNGTGEGAIILQIAPNTGDLRQGFATISGLRVNITQRRG